MQSYSPSSSGRYRWIAYRNVSSSTIPSFAPIRLVGVDDHGILSAVLPTDDSQRHLAANGPCRVLAGNWGQCRRDWPAHLAYNLASGTPANGDLWGSEVGSSEIHQDQTGFIVIGGATEGRVLVVPDPTCCVEQSGSSGAQGPCSCCDDAKETYYVTITNVSGCECMDGLVIPVDLRTSFIEDPGFRCPVFYAVWIGGLDAPACNGVNRKLWARLECISGGAASCANYRLAMSCIDATLGEPTTWPSGGAPTSCTCDPFYLLFEYTPTSLTFDQGVCCYHPPSTIGGNISAEVTE